MTEEKMCSSADGENVVGSRNNDLTKNKDALSLK